MSVEVPRQFQAAVSSEEKWSKVRGQGAREWEKGIFGRRPEDI